MTTGTAHQPAAGRPRGKTPDGTAGTPDRRTAKTADQLLREARALLPRRPSPAEARAAQARGAGDQPAGAPLEWRCDPAGRWRHPALTGRDQHLILICQEGFQS